MNIFMDNIYTSMKSPKCFLQTCEKKRNQNLGVVKFDVTKIDNKI